MTEATTTKMRMIMVLPQRIMFDVADNI
jgi:hypothetical protein